MSRLITSVALLAMCSSACVRDDGPTQEDYNDVALGVGTMVSGDGDAGEVASMRDAVQLSIGEIPPDMSNSGSGSYRGIRGGLEYSYDITCTDVDGGDLPACGDATDSAHLVLAWSGDLSLPRYSATVDRTGDWTLADIQSGTAVFNGDGTFDLDSEFQALLRPVTRTFTLSYAANYQDILVETDSGDVVGGVATYAISARRTASNRFRDVEAEFDIDAVLTFDGSGQAILDLDGSRSYRIDLASGTVIAN